MVLFSDRVNLMARELTRHAVDLGDERAVDRHLKAAGFSSDEIDAGIEAAIDTARVERINEDILAGLAGGEWPGVA